MPRLEYDVVFNISSKSVSTVRDQLNKISGGNIENAKNSAQELNIQLDRTQASADEAKQALQGLSSGSTGLTRLERNARNAASQTDNLSKAANNSNQILFSFGDAVQDGAQFTQGFASGARAVGNNITFAAEQISIASQKAGSLTGAFKQIGASMLGPAGVVVGINLLVTAITVIPQLFENSAVSADKLRESLSGVNSELEDFVVNTNNLDKDQPLFTTQKEEELLRVQLSQQESLLTRINEKRQEILNRTTSGGILGGARKSTEQDEEALRRLNQLLSTTEDRIGKLRSEISAADIIATTPEGIQAQAEQARRAITEEFGKNLSEDIIPADISVPDLGVDLGEAIILGDSPAFEQKKKEFRRSFQRFATQLQQDIGQVHPPPDLGEQRAEEEAAKANVRFETRLANARGFERKRLQLTRERINTEVSLMEAGVEEENAKRLAQAKYEAQLERSKTEISKRQSQQRLALVSQAVNAAGALLSAAFGKNKAVRIAMALLDTYASAQSAFASQLVPGDPTSLVRAQVAAGLAITSGLARIATMQSIEPDGGGVSGSVGAGGGGRKSGFYSSDVTRVSQPDARVAQDARQQESPTIVVEANNILPDTEFSVRAERGRKERIGRVVKA